MMQEAVAARARARPSYVAHTFDEFMKLEPPHAGMVLEPWLPIGGSAMLFSWRGVGKTWVALGISVAIATGGEFLGWTAPQPRKVVT